MASSAALSAITWLFGIAAREADQLIAYLQRHPNITNVLITGGDPLVMRTAALRRTLVPLLEADLPGLATVRIRHQGAGGYRPDRFLVGDDADDLLRLFEEITARGIHLALMAHSTHPRELDAAAAAAIRRVRSTGAVIRCQAPLIRRVNDDARVWADLWRAQVRLGAVPYYMFVERDTGPKEYFKVPLARAVSIFADAYRQVSGLCRTARCVDVRDSRQGRSRRCVGRGGRLHFALRVLPSHPAWVGRTFLAEYDERAAWLDELRPSRRRAPSSSSSASCVRSHGGDHVRHRCSVW